MKSIRQLETSTKLFACFAIVLCLGVLASAWLLGQLADMSELTAQAGQNALVGREEELELLLRHWHQAKSGEGCVVLLSGEPGIGKSRLAAALSERIASEPHLRLKGIVPPSSEK